MLLPCNCKAHEALCLSAPTIRQNQLQEIPDLSTVHYDCTSPDCRSRWIFQAWPACTSCVIHLRQRLRMNAWSVTLRASKRYVPVGFDPYPSRRKENVHEALESQIRLTIYPFGALDGNAHRRICIRSCRSKFHNDHAIRWQKEDFQSSQQEICRQYSLSDSTRYGQYARDTTCRNAPGPNYLFSKNEVDSIHCGTDARAHSAFFRHGLGEHTDWCLPFQGQMVWKD